MVFRGAANGHAEIVRARRTGLAEEHSAELSKPWCNRRFLGGKIGCAVIIGKRWPVVFFGFWCRPFSGDHSVEEHARNDSDDENAHPPKQTVGTVFLRGFLLDRRGRIVRQR